MVSIAPSRRPSVSVIIPTYNRAHFIGDALGSIFAQTQPVDEIIVVDDGSTDRTREVLQSYGSRIRVIHQRNSGPAAARNNGLRAATGDLVSFLDSDDIWMPEKNRTQCAFMAANPDVDICFGLMANYTAASDALVPAIDDPRVYDRMRRTPASIPDMLGILLERNVVPTPAVMARRGVFDRLGFFPEHMRQAEDYAVWLKAACVFKWGFVDAILMRRRLHETNLTNDWAERKELVVSLLDKFANELPSKQERSLFRRKLRTVRYDLGSYYLYHNQPARACHHLRSGFPMWVRGPVWALKLIYAEARRLQSRVTSPAQS